MANLLEAMDKEMSVPLGFMDWKQKLRLFWSALIRKEEVRRVKFTHRDGHVEYFRSAYNARLTSKGMFFVLTIDLNRSGLDCGDEPVNVAALLGYFSNKVMPADQASALAGLMANGDC